SNSKGIRKLESGNYEIGTLLFKVKMLCLYDVNGKEIELNYQQAKLLKMLLEDDDHFISKETTINIFWEDTKNATKKSDLNDCFNTCVSRLRKALSKDKDIELLCKTKKGYQLIVNNNPPEKESK
ncbi:winged helix-turn-helix domain-containing protein, partial [Parabacteroides pacaensis]|uniref:winged helix-turn-helix domain-containing protein n=1 Tax=Parabacteroides pacaensis TaxID=2086575 RepID=UPI00131D0E55